MQIYCMTFIMSKAKHKAIANLFGGPFNIDIISVGLNTSRCRFPKLMSKTT